MAPGKPHVPPLTLKLAFVKGACEDFSWQGIAFHAMVGHGTEKPMRQLSNHPAAILAREWRAKNPDKLKRWRDENKDKVRAQQMLWRDENYDHLLALNRKYRREKSVKIRTIRNSVKRSNRRLYVPEVRTLIARGKDSGQIAVWMNIPVSAVEKIRAETV